MINDDLQNQVYLIIMLFLAGNDMRCLRNDEFFPLVFTDTGDAGMKLKKLACNLIIPQANDAKN